MAAKQSSRSSPPRSLALPTGEEMARVLGKGVEALPTLPLVAVRLAAITRDERSSAADLARVVNTDPAITGRVLQLVNTPAYGRPGRVYSLDQAVVMLGFDTVHQLAMGVAVHDNLIAPVEGRGGFEVIHFWRHCLAVAVVARLVAREVGGVDPDAAYVAGLLHDMGKLVLQQHGVLVYERVLDHLDRTGGVAVEEERELVGLGHDDVGGYLAHRWGLPAPLIQAIGHHHRGMPVDADPALSPLTATVALADFIAWSHGLGSVPKGRLPRLHPQVDKLLHPQRLDLPRLVREMDQQVGSTAEFYRFRFPEGGELRENLLRANLTLGCLNSAGEGGGGWQGPDPREAMLVPHRSLDRQRIVTTTLEAIQRDCGVGGLALFLVEPRGRGLVMAHSLGVEGETAGMALPLDQEAGVVRQALRGREPLVARGMAGAEGRLKALLGVPEVGLVPVTGEGRVLGVLVVGGAEESPELDPACLDSIVLVAQELGVALNHATTLLNQRRKARRDGLTGLLNRAALDRALEKVVARTREEGTPLALAMLDVDHFKRFNDTFGHANGDLVLRLVAKVLTKGSRSGSWVGRYGGEEFTAILPGAGLTQAMGFGRRIQRMVERLGLLLEPRFTGHPLTISVGVAAWRPGMKKPRDLVEAADRALYRAKEGGRNRVEGPDDTEVAIHKPM